MKVFKTVSSEAEENVYMYVFYYIQQFSVLTSCLLACILLAHWMFIIKHILHSSILPNTFYLT